ncbi:hypothetical protein [Acaryochloris marina]|uniref:hypothetical protein n=1 Tax=Acaryochloris marina TaxID=155978 RepID=UPI001EE67C70|nr:hypothetical protein [Acaryochloris marina]
MVRCQRVELLGSKQGEQASSNTVAPAPTHTPPQPQRQVKPPVASKAGGGSFVDDNIPF